MTERLNQNQPRFSLVQDNDCHWYLIPADQRDFWDEWLTANENDGFDAEWILPEWARAIDGPHSLSFTDPQ